MQELTVIIPIAPNDVDSFMKTFPYIKSNIDARKFVVIARDEVKDEISAINDIEFVDEDSILPGLTYNKTSELIRSLYPKALRRTGWYFQQFLKLSYSSICNTQYYMSWDSDTIPTRKLVFFDDTRRPYLDYVPYVSDDKDYFTLLKTISNGQASFRKECRESFITEHMVFSVDIVKKMIFNIEQNESLYGTAYWEKILRAISRESLNLSGFSEFETYAAFVLNNFPSSYSLRRWNNLRNGRFYLGANLSTERLKWAGKSFDVVSFEDYDSQSFILRIILLLSLDSLISFDYIYVILNPYYKLKHRIRMLIRRIVRS